MNSLINTVQLLILSTFLGACAVFGIRSEETPVYKVIEKDGDIEVRRYESYLVATTEVKEDFKKSSSTGFRRLAGYIFGKNTTETQVAMTAPVVQEKSSESIAMTAPVVQEKSSKGSWKMSFMMPSKYTMETLPKPLDPEVKIEEVKEKTLAVLRYSGSRDEKKNEKMALELISWLEKSSEYQIQSEPSFAGYDPPWTLPFFRRNEVMIEVEAID